MRQLVFNYIFCHYGYFSGNKQIILTVKFDLMFVAAAAVYQSEHLGFFHVVIATGDDNAITCYPRTSIVCQRYDGLIVTC